MSFTINLAYWQSPIATPSNLTIPGGGGDYSGAYGINNAGNIVGAVSNISGYLLPYYWSSSGDTSPTQIPLGTGTEGNALGINTAGNIVGNIGPNPYYWASSVDTSPTPLSLGTGTLGSALGINTAGNIVGSIGPDPYYWTSSGDTSPTPISLGTGSQGTTFGINTAGNIVGQIDNQPYYWASSVDTSPTPLSLGTGVVGVAFGINTAGNIVGQIDNQPYYWASFGASPTPMSLGTGVVGGAIGINDSENIVGIYISREQPISNICFPAGTPVKTDQGIIPIDKLNTNVHTIHGESILHITQTTTLDPYLICFKPNSISRNVPNQTTIMSKEHKIEFDGKMVSAYRFLNLSREVKKVKYNGEILYNVLLANYGRMTINNLICETLHPDNIIAKLYTNNTDADRQTKIRQLNKYLTEGNMSMYKSAVNSITHKL